MNKLICQKCGGEISNEFGITLFHCTNCGAGIQSLPTPISPKLLNNNPPSNSKMTLYFLGCLGLGAVLLSALGIFGYLYWSGKNPLAKFTKQYNCTIAGEPEPTTSEEYFIRAQKHIEIFSEGRATSFDDCAFAALNEALRLDSNNTDALRVRGYAYHRSQKYDLALTDYGNAIEIVPKDPRNYYFRSIVYIEKKLFEKALADISEAIRLKPDDDEYYDKRADIYLKLGKIDLAATDEQKALELISAKNGKTPTPAPSKTPNNPDSTKTISGGVLNEKATNLVKPTYPASAKAVRASGQVSVQVTLDEKGDVISASAVSVASFLGGTSGSCIEV